MNNWVTFIIAANIINGDFTLLIQYSFTVEVKTSISSSSSSSELNQFWKVAAFIKQTNLVVGWDYVVSMFFLLTSNQMDLFESPWCIIPYPLQIQPISDPTQAFMESLIGNQDGSAEIEYLVTVSRTQFVQFFAVLVLVFMWLLSSFAVVYGAHDFHESNIMPWCHDWCSIHIFVHYLHLESYSWASPWIICTICMGM